MNTPNPLTIGDLKKMIQGLPDKTQILIGGDKCFDWANISHEYDVPNEEEGFGAFTLYIKDDFSTWQF